MLESDSALAVLTLRLNETSISGDTVFLTTTRFGF
jgi:hypothetical protein